MDEALQQREADGLSIFALSLAASPLVLAATLCLFSKSGNGGGGGRRTSNAAPPNPQENDSPVPPGPPRRAGDDGVCAICLEQRRFSAATMCGHRFCTTCIVEAWQRGHSAGTQPLACPCCRTTVTLLVAEYSSSEDGDGGEATAAQNLLNDYNAQHGTVQAGTFMERLRVMPILLGRLSRQARQRPIRSLLRIMWLIFQLRRAAFFLASFLYLVSPVDLIPEALFGAFGLIDDALVFFICAIVLAGVIRHELVQQARRGG